MVRYIKCPRCELNYIDAEKQEYCDVCLKEMKGIKTDADEIEEEETAELPTELCPVCGENMMRAGEQMCEECRKKAEREVQETDPESEDDDEWREYLDDDSDDLDADIEGIDETFDEEFDDELSEEDEEYHGDDDEEDLDYVTEDEIYALDGDDEDDEDDEDDDF